MEAGSISEVLHEPRILLKKILCDLGVGFIVLRNLASMTRKTKETAVYTVWVSTFPALQHIFVWVNF